MTARVEGVTSFVTDYPQSAEALLPARTLWTSRPVVHTDVLRDVFVPFPRLRPGRRLVLNHREHPVRRGVPLFVGRRTVQGECWGLPFDINFNSMIELSGEERLRQCFLGEEEDGRGVVP